MLQTNNGERLTVILVDSSDVIFLGLGVVGDFQEEHSQNRVLGFS